MSTLTREDIARMRDELRKDLEALDRVEKLLARGNGIGTPQVETVTSPAATLREDIEHEQVRRGLKQLCINGLKIAGPIGAAPKDLLTFCKGQGYSFTSDVNGSASVTTALSRLVNDGRVRKNDGRYYWIGGD